MWLKPWIKSIEHILVTNLDLHVDLLGQIAISLIAKNTQGEQYNTNVPNVWQMSFINQLLYYVKVTNITHTSDNGLIIITDYWQDMNSYNDLEWFP